MSAADIVDTSHVDAALASAQRADEHARKRRMVAAVGRATLWGGLGIAAIIAALSLLLQPKVIETTKVVEAPGKAVEEPHKEPTVRPTVAKPLPKWPGEQSKPVEKPKVAVNPPPPPPPPPVVRKWDQLTDKQYVGVITDLVGDHICFNHDLMNCTWVAVMDGNRHALLDPEGNAVVNHNVDGEPMRKWISYKAYSAVDPDDPAHLRDYWVADGDGNLITFVWTHKEPLQ